MPTQSAFKQTYVQEMTFFTGDVGVTIQCNLFVQDFDPTGATATLVVDQGFGTRAMVFDTNGRVATYAVLAGEFLAGAYSAQVKIVKGGLILYSEIFKITVSRTVA